MFIENVSLKPDSFTIDNLYVCLIEDININEKSIDPKLNEMVDLNHNFNLKNN